MGNPIGTTIQCQICETSVVVTSSNQITCKSRECRLKLRCERRKAQRRADRKANPIPCEYCGGPITEIGLRQYHRACMKLLRAEKAADYNYRHNSPYGPQEPRKGPKKPRRFKGSVTCSVCKRSVKRQGARQSTCLAPECQKARKNKRRNKSRKARKKIEARLAEAKERKLQNARIERETYRPGSGLRETG